MAAITYIGLLVIALIIGVGVYKLATSITFRPTPVRYVYVKDSDGVETVVENTTDNTRRGEY